LLHLQFQARPLFQRKENIGSVKIESACWSSVPVNCGTRAIMSWAYG